MANFSVNAPATGPVPSGGWDKSYNINNGWGSDASGNPTYNGSSAPGAFFQPGQPTGPVYNSPSKFDATSLITSNGNPQGGVYGQPGAFGNPVGGVPGVGQPNPNAPAQAFTPTYSQVPGGYNPLQYADLATTNTLAQMLGGNGLQTKLAGAFTGGAPPQNSIDFGGDSPLNAGLLADRYSKYDRATADAMTRAELALQGPRSQNTDSAINTQFQALPGALQSHGTGANLGSSVGSAAPVTPAAQSAAQGPAQQPPASTPVPTPVATQPQAPATNPGQVHANPGIQDSQISAILEALGLGGNQYSQQSRYINPFSPYPLGQGSGSMMYNPFSPTPYPAMGYGGYQWRYPDPFAVPQNPQTPQNPYHSYQGGGGAGQFGSFAAMNNYQPQLNSIWSRPGSMSGFANTMNNFNQGRYSPYAGNQYAGYSRQY